MSQFIWVINSFFCQLEPDLESSSKDDLDLNSIPATKTLSNEHLLEKKRLAEAQQKKYKPTRASWGKSLDDDSYDVRHYIFDSSAYVIFLQHAWNFLFKGACNCRALHALDAPEGAPVRSLMVPCS